MSSNRHKASDQTAGPTTSAPTSEDALLDAAREGILAVGWSRTTLTDVARRAGVSRMTLYRRWPDMQSLLADLMTREWTQSVMTSTATDGGSALDDLVAAMATVITGIRANPLLRKIIEVDPELLMPYLLDRRGRSQDLVLALLVSQVKAGQKDGSIRLGKPEVLARSVLLTAHGFTLSAHTMLDGVRDKDADVSAFDAELKTIIERYLQP